MVEYRQTCKAYAFLTKYKILIVSIVLHIDICRLIATDLNCVVMIIHIGLTKFNKMNRLSQNLHNMRYVHYYNTIDVGQHLTKLVSNVILYKMD